MTWQEDLWYVVDNARNHPISFEAFIEEARQCWIESLKQEAQQVAEEKIK